MKIKTMAKINLGLDVLGRRPNGYHDVRMIMQNICLYDELEIISVPEPGIHLTINREDLPADESNLVYKAADLLMKEFAINGGVKITLDKQIPMAAGMAGGSADAAATLKGVNAIFSLGLSEKELMERGLRLGADIPYCIMGGTALAEGIGEILTELAPPPEGFVLIAKPPVGVSTKYVYQHLVLDEHTEHPDMDGVLQGLQEGNLAKMAASLGNVLETVTIPVCPPVGELKKLMCSHGALNALMSGSGPTVFGLFEEETAAEQAAEAVKNSGLAETVVVTRMYRKPGKA